MYKLGCIKSKKDIRDYKINKISKVEFPSSFTLQSQTILNQGEVNSCVAHSLSSILESIYHDVFSVGFIYGYRIDDDYFGEGMSINNALKNVIKTGAVKKRDFDYNLEMTRIYELVNVNKERLLPLASENKLGAYARLNGTNDIKIALMRGLPILISVEVKSDYLSTTNGIINITNNEYIGNHAMMLYGWNETGWLVQNSWGTSWGNNGTAILPYEYEIEESYCVSLKAPEPIKPDEPKEEPIILEPDIVKPNIYQLRELVNYVIKFVRFLANLIKK